MSVLTSPIRHAERDRNRSRNQTRDQTRNRARRVSRRLIVEQLEDRRVFAAVPAVSVSVPANVFIGEQATVQVSFDNTSPSDVGYGPFIDVLLARNGADGVAGAGTDGVSYVPGSANYLGAAVTTTVLTFPAGAGNIGTVTHPYAVDNTGTPLQISGPTGDQLLVFQLPFGSFTAGQPAATVSFETQVSNLADLSTPLTIRSRGGFRYGNDPLDNPAADPSLVSQASTSATTWSPQSAVTPILVDLQKTYIGPEDETATGPNFVRQYRIDVDVAAGQTITSADIVDLLPNNVVLVSVDTITPAGSTTVFPTPTPANSPNNQLVVTIPSITGTTSGVDATVVFSFFVPFRDAGANIIISPVTGNDVISQNNTRLEADWTPIDTRDPSGNNNVIIDRAGPEHVLIPKSIATQKSVALQNDIGGSGYSAGDTVQYAIQFQISDFFAFDNLVIDDIISDGQRFDTGFVPTLSVTEHGVTISSPLAGPNYTLTDHFTGGSPAVAPINGTQQITFNISDEMVDRGDDAILLGGLVPSGGTTGPDPNATSFNGGATIGTIVFRAIVQDDFTDVFPSGDQSVDEGDHLTNDVTIDGRVLNYANLSPEQTEADTSAAAFDIIGGTLTKAIFAINGNTTLPSPLRLAPGDDVTYRIQLSLPTSDIEDLQLEDYLPLPVLLATQVMTFDDTVNGAIPAAGQAKFGPADTFRSLSGIVPLLSTDAVSNRVSFTYGDFDTPASVVSNIDLLFTVTASSAPFADGLFLTNQVRRTQDSTNAAGIVDDAIVQIQLGEPNLNITKGIVASNNPGTSFSPGVVGPVSFSAPGSAGYRGASTINSTTLAGAPINSNTTLGDAGDLVTFAIIVENTGTSRRGAFDIQLRDSLPSGFVVPGGGLNLSVTDGTGTVIAFNDLGGGLLGTGIELVDPGSTPGTADGTNAGALDKFDATDGRNILVVTFDLMIASTATPLQNITNTATLFNYAGNEAGPDFTTNNLSDTATATIRPIAVDKSIVSTNQAFTAGNNVAIGEIVTYQSVITIPEGVSPAVVFTDLPDAGLSIANILSVTPSSGSLNASAGSFASIFAGASIAANGTAATLTFGDIANSNTDDTTAETITIQYTAVVLNNAGNNRGTQNNNQARVAWTGNLRTDSSPNTTVVEPTLSVVKDVTPSSGQAGQVFTITLDVAHTGASNAGAFNVALSDVLPAGFVYVGPAASPSGLAPTTLGESSGTITATWDSFPLGSTSRIVFTAQTTIDVIPGTTITNAANAVWSSLPGNVLTPQSSSPVSTERTGNVSDPGGANNDYRASGSDTADINTPVVTKTLVTTNQAHTAGANVAIGEIVTYEVVFTVPHGTLPATTFVDLPDAGLAIVGVDSVTASVDVATSIGTMTDVANNAVVAASGTSVTFNFGDLTNSNNDVSTTESVTIRYRAVVLNTLANNRNVVLDNQGNLNWNMSNNVPVDGPDVTIIEPALDVQTTITPATGQGNDLVEVVITLAHAAASNATALDLTLADILPVGLVYDSGLTNSAGLAPTTLTQSGPTINATYASFPLASTSEIRFFARLATSVQPGETIVNPVGLAWTSLPGNVTTAQSSNPLSTERTGSTSNPGGTANDHIDLASDSITIILPVAAKSLVTTNQAHTSGSNVAIGEIVTYDVVLTIPQGTTPSARFVDTPDAGLAIVDVVSINASPDVTSSLGSFATIQSGSVIPASGSSLSIDFGTLINNNTNSAANETITVRYRAVVLNTTTNDRGDVLDNQVAFNWGSSGSVAADGPDVAIVEPALGVTVSDGAPAAADAGDVVTFTLTVAHTGTSNADAFDVNLQNLIDSVANHLQYDPGTINVVSGGGAVLASASETGGDLASTWTSFPLGATATITFDVIIQTTAPASTSLVNAASILWTSLPGDVTTNQSSNALSVERTGRTADPGASANDHNTGDTGQITTNPPESTKTIVSTSVAETGTGQLDPTREDLVIGELVTYSIVAVLPEGTNTLAITDQLPTAAGVLELVSATVNLVGSRLTASAPTIAISNTNADAFDDRVVFDFGSVVNSPDGVVNIDDTVEIYIVARLVDVPANVDAAVLTNTATINLSGAVSVATTEIEIVEPLLEIDKAATVTSGPPGTTVPYTVVIRHQAGSHAIAYDLAIADLLADTNLTLVPTTVVSDRGTIVSGNGAGDTTIGINLASLLLNETFTITFDAIVDPSAGGSVTVNNASTLVYDNTPGPGGRVDIDSDNESFVTTAPEIDLQIVKSDSEDPAVVDSPLRYTLVITNNGPSTATGVSFNDNLPVGLTNISAAASQGSVLVSGLVVTGSLGTILPGASVTITIDVTTPSVDGTITNSATVSANETDTDPSNDFDDEDTLILATSTLAGVTFVDTNRNGVTDSGEFLLPGVLITLTGIDDTGASILRTLTTASNGQYYFDRLRPGTYQVRQTQPTLFVDSRDYIGSEGGALVGNDAVEVTLPAGLDAVDYNFTELGLRGIALSKRSLLNSRLRQATPIGFAYDDFFAALAPRGQADLDGDGDVDNDDYVLFQGRIGGTF